jgi:hypothetical protein
LHGDGAFDAIFWRVQKIVHKAKARPGSKCGSFLKTHHHFVRYQPRPDFILFLMSFLEKKLEMTESFLNSPKFRKEFANPANPIFQSNLTIPTKANSNAAEQTHHQNSNHVRINLSMMPPSITPKLASLCFNHDQGQELQCYRVCGCSGSNSICF